MAQVARPHRVAGRAAAQVDAHGDLALLHHALAVFFAVRRVAAAVDGHVHVVQVQVDPGLIQVFNARITHGRQNAPQVRIAGEERGLDERRMRDGIRHLAAFGCSLAAIDLHRDELGGALAVTHDGLRQQAGNAEQRLLQGLAVGRIERRDRRIRCLVGGDDDERIVGRRVTVDGDAVERAFGQFQRQLVHHRLVDARVGGQKTQHGRHVGADHAGAFADAGDGDVGAAHLGLGAESLGHRVGGHDAFGGARPVVGRGVGNGGGQAGFDALDRQRLHDDAGRKRQHLRRIDLEQRGQRGAGLPRARQAVFARAGVGVAGVDHQRADVGAALQALTADLNRRGAKAVAGEHAADAGARIQQHHRQVLAARLAHAGLGDADAHAGHGLQVGSHGGAQVHGHGASLLKVVLNEISLWRLMNKREQLSYQ